MIFHIHLVTQETSTPKAPNVARRLSMQTIKSIMEELNKELTKRKFHTWMLSASGKTGFAAYNKNFSASRLRIEVIPECETVVNVIIGDENNELLVSQFNVVMREFMQHFDRYEDKHWGIVMKIHSDGGRLQDIGDIANIIARAYSLAATTL